MEETKQWLEFVVKGLVTHKDSVNVDVKSDTMGVLFTVKVHDEDAGKVIGKAGSTADSLRNLLHGKGFMHNIRASLRLDVPGKYDR